MDTTHTPAPFAAAIARTVASSFSALSLLAVPLLVLSLLAMTDAASAQSRHDVTGTVTDSLDAPLQGATVVVLTPTDSTMVGFGITGPEGRFNVRRVPMGAYVLQVTFVGFETRKKDIEVGNADLDVGRLVLSERVSELDELVVSDEHIPLLVRSDTIIYNAAAFGVRPNASVEDLLRRLPGLEVAQDGSIKAQGEDVKKVLVDGKEFFGDDPKIATRNLPADAVNNVEVYDDRSDLAEFTGVDDGEREKTINLELKEDARQGYFGNVSGAVGDDLTAALGQSGRHDTRVSVNRFSPSTQFSVLGNFNDVNKQGFSFNEIMGFSGGIGGMMAGGVSMGGLMGGGSSDGFVTTRSGGVNFNRDLARGTELRTSYFLNSVDRITDRALTQEELVGSGAGSTVAENRLETSESTNHRLNLNAFHELTDGHDLRLRLSGSLTDSDARRTASRTARASDVLRNSSSTFFDSRSDQRQANGSLTWRRRLSDSGTSLVGEISGSVRDQDGLADLVSANSFFEDGNLKTEEDLNQLQETLGTSWTDEEKLTLTHPLSKKRTFETSVRRRAVRDDESRSFFDLVDGAPVFNLDVSSGLDRTYTYISGGIGLRQNTRKWQLGAGVDLQGSHLEGTILRSPDTVNERFTHLLPRADARLRMRRSTVSLRYSTSTREPSMQELQPFEDNSDPITVRVGNPELDPEYVHRFSLSYNFFDQFSFTNFFVWASASYTDNKIARSREVTPDLRQRITSVNTDGDWSLTGNVNFGRPIRPLGVKASISNRARFSRGIEFVNSEENVSRILVNTVEGRLENRNQELFAARAGARLDFNRSRYSLNPGLNQDYVNRTFFGEATLYAGDTWQLSGELDYRIYSDELSGTEQRVPLVNATLSRFLMQQKMELQLSGVDLLNENVGVNFNNSGTFVQEERVNSLGRYVMFRLVYNLSPVRR